MVFYYDLTNPPGVKPSVLASHYVSYIVLYPLRMCVTMFIQFDLVHKLSDVTFHRTTKSNYCKEIDRRLLGAAVRESRAEYWNGYSFLYIKSNYEFIFHQRSRKNLRTCHCRKLFYLSSFKQV